MENNEWYDVNATPCTSEEIEFLVQKAIEAVYKPDNHGRAYAMMGNTLVMAYTRFDGAIDIEVTERKRAITIKHN